MTINVEDYSNIPKKYDDVLNFHTPLRTMYLFENVVKFSYKMCVSLTPVHPIKEKEKNYELEFWQDFEIIDLSIDGKMSLSDIYTTDFYFHMGFV